MGMRAHGTLLIDSGNRDGYSWRAFAIEGTRGKLLKRLDPPSTLHENRQTVSGDLGVGGIVPVRGTREREAARRRLPQPADTRAAADADAVHRSWLPGELRSSLRARERGDRDPHAGDGYRR